MAQLHKVALAIALALTARPVAGAGISVTVVTIAGESIRGTFLGATEEEVTISTPSAIVKRSLRDVSYVSFVGRPPSAEAVSYTPPASRSSQLRMEGSVLETAGRLDEAEGKYQEAAKVDQADPLTLKALARIQQKRTVKEAGEKARGFKKLAAELTHDRRYGEAAACYDEAVRLDPYDRKFAESLEAMRHYWQPSACPLPAQKLPEK